MRATYREGVAGASGDHRSYRTSRRAFLKKSLHLAAGVGVGGSVVTVLTPVRVAGQSPVAGGQLAIVIPADPPTMSPTTTHSTTGLTASPITEGLLRLGLRNGKMVALPNLARSWEVARDGLGYTFHLEPGVRWHDGRPFSSADVKFTIEKVIRSYHPLGGTLWSNLAGIDTPDTNTAIIRLKVPFPALLTMLGSGWNFGTVLPQHLYEGTDILNNPHNSAPVGTGPFRFVEWKRGSYIRLARNPNYWRKGRPYINEIVYNIIVTPTARVNAMLSGEADYMDWQSISPEQLTRFSSARTIEIVKAPQTAAGLCYLNFNLRLAALKDVRVRRAIAYAIDRKLLTDVVFGGNAKPATAHVSSALGPIYWNSTKPLERYTHTLDAANKLLDEAGYHRGSDGTRLRLRYIFNAEQGFQFQVADVIRDQLRSVGIAIEIIPLQLAAFIAKAYGEWDFDLQAVTLTGGPVPEIFIARFFQSNNIRQGVSFSNNTGYVNPLIDQLFLRSAQARDEHLQRQYWYQIEYILADELPALPLWEIPYPIVFQRRVHGFGQSPNEAGGEVWWDEVWKER